MSISKLFCFEYLLNPLINIEYTSVSSEYENAKALKVIVFPTSILKYQIINKAINIFLLKL